MNPKELRIGNWVNVVRNSDLKSVEVQVDGGLIAHMTHSESHAAAVEPIPITPEWLEMLGFEKTGWPNEYSISIDSAGNAKLEITTDGKHWIHNGCAHDGAGGDGMTLYIHSLQNLYFALTGKELTVKQPATT